MVELSSEPFRCNAHYPPDKRYQVFLMERPGQEPTPLGQYPVAPDGNFRAVIHIPRAAHPGDGRIIVRGSTFDSDCEDTSSCAPYAINLTIQPPSS